MTTIAKAEGAHLTAADRRNIKALLAHDGFEFGRAFEINGRKSYSLTDLGADRLEVAIVETDVDDFGRSFSRSYRSTFTARKATR